MKHIRMPYGLRELLQPQTLPSRFFFRKRLACDFDIVLSNSWSVSSSAVLACTCGWGAGA